jgi:hypothetical protein
MVAEPLSLVRPGATPPVDALFFDANLAGEGLLARWRKAWAALGSAPATVMAASTESSALAEVRRSLQQLAERGLPAESPRAWLACRQQLLDQATAAGLSAFAALRPLERSGEALLRMNYLRLSYEALSGNEVEPLE